MRGRFLRQLVIKLKTGETKKYAWNKVDVEIDTLIEPFVLEVRDKDSKERLLLVPLDNFAYYEVEIVHGN